MNRVLALLVVVVATAFITPANVGAAPKAGQLWREPVTGMVFVWVPGGSFQMGCGPWAGECSDDEKPVHMVTLKGFWVGRYEVTQLQWGKVMGNNPSGSKKGPDYPVENVSWDDAQQFIRKLSEANKGAYQFALPTEAQWEYACRSGGRDEMYCGGNYIDGLAWYDKNSNLTTHLVGTKQPNGIGIYDMSGNVWEWCQDWKGEYPSGSQTDPVGPSSGSGRVFRGGNWGGPPGAARSAYRGSISPAYRYDNLGFRLVSPQVR